MIRFSEWNLGALIGAGVVAGVVQAAAGVVMYLAGVYFAAWSMLVGVGVLVLCIVVGTSWYANRYLNGGLTYAQATLVGIGISVCTGAVYAVYNLITISYVYPDFLDEAARAYVAQAGNPQQGPESFAAVRAQVSALGIAIPNLIRLSVFGTVLSLVAALFLRRKKVTSVVTPGQSRVI